MSATDLAPLDRRWIEAHIPHRGRMCLLDDVRHWDATSIRCTTSSHRAADHPLRSHGRLGAACLIEYAAQAVAVHGALLSAAQTPSASPVKGLLASARALELLVPAIDAILQELTVAAHRRHSDSRGALYDFEVRAGEELLARGRLSVALEIRQGKP